MFEVVRREFGGVDVVCAGAGVYGMLCYGESEGYLGCRGLGFSGFFCCAGVLFLSSFRIGFLGAADGTVRSALDQLLAPAG